MKFRTLIIAACAILPVSLNAQQVPATPGNGSTASAAKSSPNVQSSAVEEIVASEDDGYRAIAYVVRWHGTRVLVEDPLAKSRLSVGDSLNFMASPHDVAGNRLLSFIFTGPACKCDDTSRRSAVTQGGTAGAKSAVGLVEEVLTAEQDGHRFVAYIVQAQGARIAVSDPLAQSKHAVGENISYLAIRNNATGNRLMAFLAVPPSDNATQAKHQDVAIPGETGSIEEVLTTSVDGFGYTAYVVKLPDARVVVDAVPGATPHRVGDQIGFVTRRIPSPSSSGPGILRFEARAPEDDKPADVDMSMTQETATVEEALTLQSDGYRFVAYIVRWHGARVAVSDALSNTNYAVGDKINFPASRATSSSGRQLNFWLFNFDKSAMSQQKQGK